MKNRVLITGANGFLGRNIQEARAASSFDLLDLNTILRKRIDISVPFSIQEDLEFDFVIHAAGKAHQIPKTIQEGEEFYETNYEGTVNLCNAIDQLKIKPNAFIFISTVAVYGVDSGVNIKEHHPLAGTSPYAKSKIQAEKFLHDWAKRNNVILGILRLPLVVGTNPPGNLGAMIKGIKNRRYFSIGSAEARKSMIWAPDIVSIFEKLSQIGGTYNLTDGYHPSFNDLEKAISSALKKTSPLKMPLIGAKAIASLGDFVGPKFPLNTEKLRKIRSTLTFDDNLAREQLNWEPSKVLSKIEEII